MPALNVPFQPWHWSDTLGIRSPVSLAHAKPDAAIILTSHLAPSTAGTVPPGGSEGRGQRSTGVISQGLTLVWPLQGEWYRAPCRGRLRSFGWGGRFFCLPTASRGKPQLWQRKPPRCTPFPAASQQQPWVRTPAPSVRSCRAVSSTTTQASGLQSTPPAGSWLVSLPSIVLKGFSEQLLTMTTGSILRCGRFI